MNIHMSVTINSVVENCSAETLTNFDDHRRFLLQCRAPILLHCIRIYNCTNFYSCY